MKKRALRTHRWKLIVPLEVPDIHGNSAIELYDLAADPGELNNVAEALPEVVGALRCRMDEWVAQRTAATGLPDPLPIHPIPLRRIGNPSAKREAGVPAWAAVSAADDKLDQGDFIGYDREES
jgi:hypothetical protein